VFRGNLEHFSYENTYRDVYTVVLQRHGEQLHNLADELFQEGAGWMLRKLARPELSTSERARPGGCGSDEEREAAELILLALKDVWVEYDVLSSMMGDVFMYMVSPASRQ
jgi:hypothetical protein